LVRSDQNKDVVKMGAIESAAGTMVVYNLWKIASPVIDRLRANYFFIITWNLGEDK